MTARHDTEARKLLIEEISNFGSKPPPDFDDGGLHVVNVRIALRAITRAFGERAAVFEGEAILPLVPTEAMLDAYEETCLFPSEEARLEHREAMRECWITMARKAQVESGAHLTESPKP